VSCEAQRMLNVSLCILYLGCRGSSVVVRFVDRVAELSVLQGFAGRGAGVSIYLYGPEGCGKSKTWLLRELVSRLEGRRTTS